MKFLLWAVGLLACVFVSFAFGVALALAFPELFEGPQRVAREAGPFIAVGDDGQPACVLPEETTLYLERQQGGESFTRYRVYVNVEGAPLPLTDAPRRNWIDPVTVVRAGEQ